MHIHWDLVVLTLALTLYDQVRTGKIIGGREAVENSHPYMVLVERTMSNGKKYCGGFLLSKDFVMTAAHCHARSYRVLVGLHNFNNQKKTVTIPVQDSFTHKDYQEGQGYKNDFMLLKLNSEALLGRSIPLAGLGDKPSSSCLVSGWGRFDNTGNMSPILKDVNVTLNDTCENDFFYCTKGPSGPAEGDSGGPLVCDDKAYGVVSNYIGNGNIPDTRFYAKIPQAREWIDSIVTSN